MRTSFKLLAVFAVFAVFYAGASLLMKGVNEFENRGETALFTDKAEMAAIASAEQQTAPPLAVSPGIWK